MQCIRVLLLCLSVFAPLIGCGGEGNKVSSQDELKAYAEQHGDTMLDPSASTPLSK